MSKRETIKSMQRFALANPKVAGDNLTPNNCYQSGPPRNVEIAVSVIKDMVQFDGMPVWMAVANKRDVRGALLPWPLWSERLRLEIAAELLDFLDGAGNPNRQRTFRMTESLGVVRAVTGAEWETFSEAFHNAEPLRFDTGPVEILSENWPGRLATRPCENPRRVPVPGEHQLIWYPVDCGACAPCIDRATVESERMRVEREKKAEEIERQRVYAAFLETDEGKQWLAQGHGEEWGDDGAWRAYRGQ